MKKILFFGCGNISQSLIKGLLNNGFNNEDIFFKDRSIRNHKIPNKMGISKFRESQKKDVGIIFLAVKPKDALNAFKEITTEFKNPKIVSLVAGVKSKSYMTISNKNELIRAMPNTSSASNNGITGIFNYSSKNTTLSRVKTIFKKVGSVIVFEKENEMHEFTGLIGSGPAYFYYLLKVYEKRILKICKGDKKMAEKILKTFIKGVSMSVSNHANMDDLINKVASKKGTTEAGIKSLINDKALSIFNDAINAASKRSKEISDEF